MRHILQKQNYQLQQLLQQAQQLQALDELVQQYLNPSMRKHCHIANYQRGSLVLATDNAAMATLLRYDTPRLLKQLRQINGFAGLANIKVQVSKIQPKTVAKTQAAPKLSAYGQQCLQHLAEILNE